MLSNLARTVLVESRGITEPSAFGAAAEVPEAGRGFLLSGELRDSLSSPLDPSLLHFFNFSFPQANPLHLEVLRISAQENCPRTKLHTGRSRISCCSLLAWQGAELAPHKVRAWNQLASGHARAQLTLSPWAVWDGRTHCIWIPSLSPPYCGPFLHFLPLLTHKSSSLPS